MQIRSLLEPDQLTQERTNEEGNHEPHLHHQSLQSRCSIPNEFHLVTPSIFLSQYLYNLGQNIPVAKPICQSLDESAHSSDFKELRNAEELGGTDHGHAEGLDNEAHQDDELAIHSSREAGGDAVRHQDANCSEGVDEGNHHVADLVVVRNLSVEVRDVEELPEHEHRN